MMSIGIKVEGELRDFQIVTSNSDSDDDDGTNTKSSKTVDTLAIPSSVVNPRSTPIGNVAVSNSENVTIGNNTYFNGPVVIKQVIQNAVGLENPSYVKTDDEDGPVQKYQEESKNDKSKYYYSENLDTIVVALYSLLVATAAYLV